MSYNLSIIQGSTFNTRLNITNSDGSYFNLENYVPTGQIRYSYGSTGVLLALRPTVYSTTSGILNLNISGSQTSSIPCGVFPYDIEIFTTGQSTENILKPIAGYINCSPEVTR
jgi:hypothetical protein